MIHQYVLAYLKKIISELDEPDCIKCVVKGGNALKYVLDKQISSDQTDIVRNYLTTINLPLTLPYKLAIHINPDLNVVDYNHIQNTLFHKLFDIGYRIQNGKSFNDIFEKDDAYYAYGSSVIFPKDHHTEPVWKQDDTGDYTNHFKFWEKVDEDEYLSYSESYTPFELNLPQGTFTLYHVTTTKHDDEISIIKTPIFVINIQRFYPYASKNMMWKEIHTSTHYLTDLQLPMASMIYNVVDTDTHHLSLLLKLLSIFRESLNIDTMKRISNIPVVNVPLCRNKDRTALEEKLLNIIDIPFSILKQMNVTDIYLVNKAIKTKYASVPPDAIVSILNKKFDLREFELDMMVRFDKEVKAYIHTFIKYAFRGKVTHLHQLDDVLINEDEHYNFKLVNAVEEDETKELILYNNFLIKKTPNHINVYGVLIINHIQILYRRPIKLIKINK